MSCADTTRGLIRTPKRNLADPECRSSWFNYYAGFSSGFVEDVIQQLDLSPRSTLLDPWLGAGTTGEIALAAGVQFKGYDLNPSMLLVAKARTFPKENESQLLKLIEDTINAYERDVSEGARSPQSTFCDPLEQWLQPSSASAFRQLESIVASLDQPHNSNRPTWLRVKQISPTASVLYVALFRTLRHFISRFQASNPTWIKLSTGPRLHISANRILAQFLTEAKFLQSSLKVSKRTLPPFNPDRYTIEQASSICLPLKTGSVDAILSSPPYCTRIDYVRATLPELALVRFPNGAPLRLLRNKMIGTPTISKQAHKTERIWGSTCKNFLSQVENHNSKASSSYYVKYFRQYFASAFASLTELDRVLKRSGDCVLVVQDSYYKDVHNDLSKIFSEMAMRLGWRLTKRLDFPVARTFAGIHPTTKRYRTSFDATESVITFRKS